MRFVLALFGALVFVSSTSVAQTSDVEVLPHLVPSEGTLGLSYIPNQDGRGLVGFNVGLDSRFHRHGFGVRFSFAERFRTETTQRVIVSGVYTHFLQGLSVGAGISYVAEQYRKRQDRENPQPSRFGIPLELTVRFREDQTFGPFVRGFANVNTGRNFAGLSLGATF